MKKLCIFDFDGTLFDSIDDVVICFNKALKKHNFSTLTKKEYIKCLGGNIDEIVSLILGDKNTLENIKLVKNTYEEYYAESKRANTIPFPKIKDVLKELQSNKILLAINSNRKTNSIKFFIDKYLWDINFIEIEGHNLNHPSKPNPYGVFKIIKKANVSLDEAVYIGDSIKDIQTAKNAGIDCILVKWGYGDKEDLKDDYLLTTIDNISQLMDYL